MGMLWMLGTYPTTLPTIQKGSIVTNTSLVHSCSIHLQTPVLVSVELWADRFLRQGLINRFSTVLDTGYSSPTAGQPRMEPSPAERHGQPEKQKCNFLLQLLGKQAQNELVCSLTPCLHSQAGRWYRPEWLRRIKGGVYSPSISG